MGQCFGAALGIRNCGEGAFCRPPSAKLPKKAPFIRIHNVPYVSERRVVHLEKNEIMSVGQTLSGAGCLAR